MKRIKAKCFIYIILFTVCCSGCSGSSDAPVPAGPTYKTFVTAAESNGDIRTAGGQTTGIASADQLCMADVNKPAGSSTYKAMLVDLSNRVACTTSLCSGGTSEHVDWVFKPNATYVQSDGTTPIFTTNANGIFDFGEGTLQLTNSFDTIASTYWTGLQPDWKLDINFGCLGWIYAEVGPNGGGFGTGDQTDASAIQGGGFCDAVRKLVCVEQ